MKRSIKINCVGYSIEADWYESSEDQVILVLSGWGSNKKKQAPLTEFLVKAIGTSALVIDYSGHGESPFDAMELMPAQHFLEIITTFDLIKQRYPNAEVTVMGTSYGGYLAVQLTKYREFKNLILRVPAIYEPKDFYTLNKNIDRQHERRYREEKNFLDNHPLLARASQFKGRTLVVWHELDEFIPKELTDKYIEIFHADSYCAKGWKHSFKTDAPEEEQTAYKKTIEGWLTPEISAVSR